MMNDYIYELTFLHFHTFLLKRKRNETRREEGFFLLISSLIFLFSFACLFSLFLISYITHEFLLLLVCVCLGAPVFNVLNFHPLLFLLIVIRPL